MENIDTTQDSISAANRPSIVEHFSIEGLFGYRSINLSSKFAATVLIAKNGSGKTTFIAALDAFLRGQFTRFAGLQFDKIICKLHGHPNELILKKCDVDQLVEIANDSDISIPAKKWEIDPIVLLEFIFDYNKNASYLEVRDNPTFSHIYAKSGYDTLQTRALCERLYNRIQEKELNISKLRKTLNSILKNYEIVYLPTYRRIELSLPPLDSRGGERRKNILTKLGVSKSGLYTADIQFGLGDISDRLRDLYSEILTQSNQGYGKISANVINDLISGDYKNSEKISKDPPTKESLEIFFSRIKDAEKEFRRIPYRSYFSTPDLKRVYSGDIPEDAKPFLNYFLDQLNTVIQETKESEELVAAFINNCNKYLSGHDQSTDLYQGSDEDFLDQKLLTFNKRNLEVKVTSSATGNEVPLESLSSGEKQMISLLARLYLYPRQKIVLIDEPELSLSLDWQKQILPDVLNAPTCKQVIAITHSPFIFDNELEPFAGSLKIKLSNKKSPLPTSNYLETEIGENENE